MIRGALTGIRGRLFLAFGVIVAVSVITSVVTWFSYGGLSSGLRRIVGENIPAMTTAVHLAEQGGILTATAATLVAAANEQERDQAWTRLLTTLQDMHSLLRLMDADVTGSDLKQSLQSQVDTVSSKLHSLDQNVRQRFVLAARRELLAAHLRWAHADFLDEVEPMVGDMRFNMQIAIDRSATGNRGDNLRQRRILEAGARNQEALLRINASVNLTVGNIARAAGAPDTRTLDDTLRLIGNVRVRVGVDLRVLKDVSGVLSLKQTIEGIHVYVDGANSVFVLRRDELGTMTEGRRLLVASRELVSSLQDKINLHLRTVNRSASATADRADSAIQRDKFLLVGAAIVSLLIAILVVWLYVGRNLVRRIISLDHSMQKIAAGDLKTAVPTGGGDEITEMADSLRQFRDTLTETHTELVQAGKLAALGQLSAGIAHELNQPLAAIRSYAHNTGILIDRQQMAEAHENLAEISRLTARTADSINHLKNFARKPSSAAAPTDVKSVTEDALSLLANRIKTEGVDVVQDFPTEALYATAISLQLEQVLVNVIGNALDAMKGSDIRLLTLGGVAGNGQVTISVGDSGTGIGEDDLSQIFDPFFTTKDVGEGLGLGLSISYNIIKDFGGSMRVSNRPGGGTEFSIHLPAANPTKAS